MARPGDVHEVRPKFAQSPHYTAAMAQKGDIEEKIMLQPQRGAAVGKLVGFVRAFARMFGHWPGMYGEEGKPA